MSTFKAPVHKADMNKTKGSWAWIARQPPPPIIRAEKGQPRFLALPAELRNLIYELVFADVTVVFRTTPAPKWDKKSHQRNKDWRAITEPCPSKAKTVLRCQSLLDKKDQVRPIRDVPWRSSISSLLLTSKQIHNEAISIMYESCTFLFEPFKLARQFLRIVSRANLHHITHLRFEHVNQAYGRSIEAKISKEKADKGLDNMCIQFTQALPNLTHLELGVQLKEYPDHIVPHFAESDRTFTAKQYSARIWFQALTKFKALKKLQHIKVAIRSLSNTEVDQLFFCDKYILQVLPPLNPALGPSLERQHEDIQKIWSQYYIALHDSIGEVVGGIILGKPDDEVWPGHLEKLLHYRAFCWAPQDPVNETLENLNFKRDMLWWDERNGVTA